VQRGTEWKVKADDALTLADVIGRVDDCDVIVMPATYQITQEAAIIAKSITIKSGVSACKIDCNDKTQPINISDSFGKRVVLENLAFERLACGQPSDATCAIYAQNAAPVIRRCAFDIAEGCHAIELSGANPIIQDCAFNTIAYRQGATAMHSRDGSEPTLAGCTFDSLDRALWADSGSAVTVQGCRFETCDSGEKGAAISIMGSGTLARIADCNFVENSALAGGGSLYCGTDANMVVVRCNFQGSDADAKGGAALSDGTTFMAQCRFVSNNSQKEGGAIAVGATGTVRVSNSVFLGNWTSDVNGLGHALYVESDGEYRGKARCWGCTFANNGGTGYGLYHQPGSSVDLINTILYNELAAQNDVNVRSPEDPNLSISYSRWRLGNGATNISADPEFRVKPKKWDSTKASQAQYSLAGRGEDWDLRLKVTSPCIDKGMNLPGCYTDVRGSLRPIDGDANDADPEHNDFDMGAYEYSEYYSGIQDGVVHAFCDVNVCDFALVDTSTLIRWGNSPPFPDDRRVSGPKKYKVNIVLISEDGLKRVVLQKDVSMGWQMPAEGWYTRDVIPGIEDSGEWYARIEMADDPNQYWQSEELCAIALRTPDIVVIGHEIPPLREPMQTPSRPFKNKMKIVSSGAILPRNCTLWDRSRRGLPGRTRKGGICPN